MYAFVDDIRFHFEDTNNSFYSYSMKNDNDKFLNVCQYHNATKHIAFLYLAIH